MAKESHLNQCGEIIATKELRKNRANDCLYGAVYELLLSRGRTPKITSRIARRRR